MRVTKEQIVNGVISYIETEVVPQVGEKSMQIIAATAVKMVKANTKLIDSFFDNKSIQTILGKSDDGTYEIEAVFQYLAESIRQYGPFPIEIPPIPFVSPTEKTLSLNDSDINEIRRRIERSN